MSFHISHCGDVHIEEDRYFGDTARCLEWCVADAIHASANLFVVNGDLTTYKATIKERNLWIDMLIGMANHAPVVLVAGNHGAGAKWGFIRLCEGQGYVSNVLVHGAGIYRA